MLIPTHHRTKIVIGSLLLLILYSLGLYHMMTFGYFLGAILVWVLVGGIGVEIGLHRLFSHNMFVASKWSKRVIGLLGCLSLNGDPIFWSSIHIGSHHRHADTKEDVHSPIHGAWHSYLGWIISEETYNQVKAGSVGRQALGDSWIRAYQRYYVLIVFSIFLSIYLINPLFFFLSFLPGVFLSFNQGPLTNYFCHTESFGYTNFVVNDRSRNIVFLSYITFGLALHNNHHRYPGKANFAIRDNEIDLGYKLAKFIGLSDRE